MIWFEKISIKKANDFVDGCLSDLLDIKFTEIGKDFLIAKMKISKKHIQPFNTMHGGATCVMAETMGSVAANLCIDFSKQFCVGLDINVNHMKPVQIGTVLMAKAIPLHIGKATHVWEIKIFDENKKMVTSSRLTVSVLNKKNI